MEVLDDGETGFGVNCNEEGEMAQHILNLLRDKRLRMAMGSKGKEKVLYKFSLTMMVKIVENIYWELLGKK